MGHFFKKVLSFAKPIGEVVAAATGNPELIPLIEGGGSLAQGQGLGKSLLNAGLAYGGQEAVGALGNAFPDTFGSTFGTQGNSLSDLFGTSSGAGSFFGPGTIGGDFSGNFASGSGLSDLFGSGNSGSFNGITSGASDPSAARASTAAGATSGGATPLAGATGGGAGFGGSGGEAGGFVNAPDVSQDFGGGFASPAGTAEQTAFNSPDLSSQFSLPSTGTSPFEAAPAAGGSVVASGNNSQMYNGLLRSGLTGLFNDTNQSGYEGENKAAQQAAAAYQPFLNNGTQANNTLADLYGNNGADAASAAAQGFQNQPGYQFARDQGISALDASAAARGNLLSGNQAKAVQDYGTGLANQTYQQYVNNLQQQAGLGANAAGGYGDAITSGAGALANGGQAKANNFNTAVGGGINALFPGNDILSYLRGQGGNNGLLSQLFQ